MVTVISAVLIGLGFLLLVVAIVRTQHLIRILPKRGRWPSMRNLMAFFAVGYTVYLVLLVTGWPFYKDLIVSEIFFLSSLFMLIVIRFTYRTIRNLLRLDELEELANTDDLTSMFNRRAIMRLLDKEFQKVQRFGVPLSVAMVDLDHFKRINDTYGHLAGDTVLKEVAQVLKRGLRGIDLLGRYGGEEFLCVLPMASADGAFISGERIRNQVKELRFAVTGREQLTPVPQGEEASGEVVTITISVGVAAIDSEMVSAEDAVAAADAAMYAAKQGGRDRTCLSSR